MSWSSAGGRNWPRSAGRQSAWPQPIDAAAGAARPARISFEDARRLISEVWPPTASWPGARSSPVAMSWWPWPRTSSARPPPCSTRWSSGPWPTPRWCPWSAWPVPASVCTPWPACSPGSAAIAESRGPPAGPRRRPRSRPGAVAEAIGRAEQSIGAALQRGPARCGRSDLHLGAGRRAGGRGGRGGQDHDAPGGGRRLRARWLPTLSARPPPARRPATLGKEAAISEVAHPGQPDLAARPRPARAQPEKPWSSSTRWA